MKTRDRKALECVQKRSAAVLAKRRPWEAEWQRIADVLLPYNVQIVGKRDDAIKAQRKDGDIINDKPSRALDALAAGMMANITSPARKWFGLQITNKGTATEESEVDSKERGYLDAVAAIIASDLQNGGWYATLSNSTYLDMGASGTAAIFMDEQPDGSVVFDPVPVGRFAVDINHLNRVDTWVREWSATADQIKKRFGEKDLPQKIQEALGRDDTSTNFAMIHAVLPCETTREGFEFSSTWWIVGDTEDVLHEGGFYEFPALVPRWTAQPGDQYGRGPGSKGHGKIRMLQHFTRGLIGLHDRMMDPPKWMAGGTTLSYRPGTVTHVTTQPGEQVQIGDIVTVRADQIAATQEIINRLEESIDETFFGDLWRTFGEDDKTGRTATEIQARREEKALRMGPLLESLNGELFEPAIERRYKMLARRGVLPELPESLQGQEIRIEFMSSMHQMQQSITLLGIRSFLADVQGVATLRSEVIDQINPDAIIAEMARASGVRADTLVSKDELEKVRAAKAQAQQQSEQAAQALAFTEGVRNVKGTDANQLSDLAGALSPAAAAQGGALSPVATS